MRRVKDQKFGDYFDAFKCIQAGEPPRRRVVRKDGSVGTKPICEVPFKTESDILVECIAWLNKKGLLVNRMNTGAGDFGGGFRTYGIVGGGDIFAIMPPNGRHLEVECKKSMGGSWSRLQRRRARTVKAVGGIYIVVHGTEELELKLRKYL